MTTIQPKILDKNELFAAFIERQANYSAVDKKQKAETDKNEESYFDKFEKELNKPHSAALKYTIAGGVAAILGGASLFFGRDRIKNAAIKLRETAIALKDRATLPDAGMFLKFKKNMAVIGEKFLNGYYVFDKAKDTTLMLGLLKIDKGLNKIGLGFLKPGKWVINFASSSLKLTRGKVHTDYQLAKLHLNNAKSQIPKKIDDLSGNEQDVLRPAMEFLTGGSLQRNLDDFASGTSRRLDDLDDAIQKEIIQKYIEAYFPKFKKLLSLKEWKRIAGNWSKALKSENPDVLRENWDDVGRRLKESALGTNNNRTPLGHSLKEMDDIIDKLSAKKEEGLTSKLFNKIYDELVAARQNIQKRLDFEMTAGGTSYAGRAIDIKAGGGITETLIPIITGGIIAGNSIKNAKEDENAVDITKKFFGNGGFELSGGLIALLITAGYLGINGVPAIIASTGTAFALNIVKKIYNKITGHVKEEPTAEDSGNEKNEQVEKQVNKESKSPV